MIANYSLLLPFRNEVETGLTFLGFIIFENKLKPRTVPAITTLRNANIRQIMCTGKENNNFVLDKKTLLNLILNVHR